ncbi:MAG: hypothetical protein WKG07_20140 [Hymenobacter sp.]
MGGAGRPRRPDFQHRQEPRRLFEGGDKVQITFKDVAGLEEAKEEVQGDCGVPEEPQQVHRARRQDSEGGPARGPSRHRQNPAGQEP